MKRNRVRMALAAVMGVAGLSGGLVLAGLPSPATAANNPPVAPGLNGQGTHLSESEAWTSCGPTLCIDGPPQDGSGGWGWTTAAGHAVTTLTVGETHAFTVTALNPIAGPFVSSGTITISFTNSVLSLTQVTARGVKGTDPFTRGGLLSFVESSTYWLHSDASTAFTAACAAVRLTARGGDCPSQSGDQCGSRLLPCPCGH